ncbi:MAG: hypothetical protein ACF8MF_12380 [Phycisphaerales bacterium JB052]
MHATTIVLIVLMVFSYLPNGWVGAYKHETGQLTDGVAGQYLIWSGRIEGVLVFEDYSEERLKADRDRVCALRDQGVIIDRPRYGTQRLWFRAPIRMQRSKGVFALPTLRHRPRQGQWDYGELVISMPISYTLLLSGACSGMLIWVRCRSVPEGGCQSCGYSLEGLRGETCPECGVERG